MIADVSAYIDKEHEKLDLFAAKRIKEPVSSSTLTERQGDLVDARGHSLNFVGMSFTNEKNVSTPSTRSARCLVENCSSSVE